MCLSPPIFSRQLLGTSISLSPTLNFLFVLRSLHLSHLHLLPPTLSKTWSLCYLFSLRLGHCVKSLLSKTWSLCHLFFHLSYFYSQYLFLTSQNSLSLSLSLCVAYSSFHWLSLSELFVVLFTLLHFLFTVSISFLLLSTFTLNDLVIVSFIISLSLTFTQNISLYLPDTLTLSLWLIHYSILSYIYSQYKGTCHINNLPLSLSPACSLSHSFYLFLFHLFTAHSLSISNLCFLSQSPSFSASFSLFIRILTTSASQSLF